jgi:hypothetical protein
LPDLLRRVAVLTIFSCAGIALLAPLTARSALPMPAETDWLLDAAEGPASTLPRDDRSGRDQSATLTVATLATPVAAEELALASLPAAPSVAMEATLFPNATPSPTPTPVAVVAAVPAPPAAGFVVDGAVWDRLAKCESGGNWAINSGNGYYGGLQFSEGTWRGYGGPAFDTSAPFPFSREEQIAVAERLHAARGFQPWPACRVSLGLP